MASASPILQAMTCFPTHTVLITWSVKRLQSRHHWTGTGQDSRKQSLMEQRQLQLVSLSICRVYQHLSLLHSPVLTLYTQFLSVLHAIRKTLQNAHQQWLPGKQKWQKELSLVSRKKCTISTLSIITSPLLVPELYVAGSSQWCFKRHHYSPGKKLPRNSL